MSVRKCPSCHNLVEWSSVVCPVCGKTKVQMIVGRIVRWMVIVILLGGIGYFTLEHYKTSHHHQHVRASEIDEVAHVIGDTWDKFARADF